MRLRFAGRDNLVSHALGEGNVYQAISVDVSEFALAEAKLFSP